MNSLNGGRFGIRMVVKSDFEKTLGLIIDHYWNNILHFIILFFFLGKHKRAAHHYIKKEGVGNPR